LKKIEFVIVILIQAIGQTIILLKSELNAMRPWSSQVASQVSRAEQRGEPSHGPVKGSVKIYRENWERHRDHAERYEGR
jgi:hypothetical protein